MVKKSWYILCGLAIAIVAVALVLMLVLVPQMKPNGVQIGSYEPVSKQEYSFSGTKTTPLEQLYTVTPDDVAKGKNTNKYEEGNINPFTPKSQITIYNEPTESANKKDHSNLLPSDK